MRVSGGRRWAVVVPAILTLSASGGCYQGKPAPPPPAAILPRFEEVTEGAGIRFRHHTGAFGSYYLPESIGSGCAFFDYDGDGRQDVFLVDGMSWPGRPLEGGVPALYRNEGGGQFRNVTAEAGLGLRVYGMGAVPGDYDNDGRQDLLITCLGPNRLFHNEGSGRFRDVTGASGLGAAPRWSWHTSAAWLDYDRDGRLDLFVGRYVRWSPETEVVCNSPKGHRGYCAPTEYPAERCLLYRNLGGGRFQDVSRATGIAGATARALGVLPLDSNGDGWCDVWVANDQAPNLLFVNEGGRRFAERGQEQGMALADMGVARAGMGIDAADVRNDGGLEVGIGNFSGEGLALYRGEGPTFTDTARSVGLVPASLSRLTFGLLFLDADLDGWSDLFTYNGHVDPHVDERGAPVGYREQPQLFRNQRGAFEDVTASAGPPLQAAQLGRGAAWGDFDDDGRPDLLLSESGGTAHLLRNVSSGGRHWIGFRLRGKRSNRNAFGAEVRVTAGGVTQRRWVHSGGSYLSQSDPRALFGLGAAARIDRIEVVWPSGVKSEVAGPPLDSYSDLDEP
jgi:hypothetical protein